jgi:hypothetical protein
MNAPEHVVAIVADGVSIRRALAVHTLAFLHMPVDSSYLIGGIRSLK